MNDGGVNKVLCKNNFRNTEHNSRNLKFFQKIVWYNFIMTGTDPAPLRSLKIEYRSKYINCKAALFKTENAMMFLLPDFKVIHYP